MEVLGGRIRGRTLGSDLSFLLVFRSLVQQPPEPHLVCCPMMAALSLGSVRTAARKLFQGGLHGPTGEF